MRARVLRLLILSTTALAGGAAAQAPGEATPTPTPQGVTALDAVTATATRTPEVAGSVAAPVSVIPREEILRRQPQNLNDLLYDMPGVEADGLPRNSVMQPQIRGLGEDRVVIRVDGVRQNFNSGHRGRLFIDPSLLKQVDVVRGPGSMLYGSGALGGVIGMRTIDAADLLRPGENITGLAWGGYQSNNRQYSGGFTSAFRSGAFDGLASVTGRTAHDFSDALGQGIPYSAADTVSGLAKLGYTVGDGIRLGFSALGFGENATIPTAANTTTMNNIAKRRLRQQQYAVTGNVRPPGQNWADAAFTLYYIDVGIDERRIVPNDGRFDTTDYQTFGLDLQNTSRFSLAGVERHQLTYGVDGYRDEQEGTRNGAPRPEFPEASQTIIGVFAQDEVAIGPVTITLGARYDSYDQSASGQPSRSDGHLSPKASVAWQVTDWAQPYLAYSEAFRAPSLVELYQTGVHFPISFFPVMTFNYFIPNPNLKPEVAANKEFGLNLRFGNVLAPRDSLRARLSIFQNDIDDYIELIVGATTTQARNVSRARIRGIEFEAGYDNGFWFATLGASALDGKNLTEGGPLSLIPAHKVALTLGHRFLESGWVVGGRAMAAATQDEKPSPSYPTSGYALFDLFATYAPTEGMFEGWRVDVALDNIFDHAYRRVAWDSGPTPPQFYEPGRNLRVALRAQF